MTPCDKRMSQMTGSVLLMALVFFARRPADVPTPLLRRYVDGEKLSYQMNAVNEDSHYEIRANGEAKRDSTGIYFEEYSWSDFIFNGQRITLSPAMVNFRQRVTLDLNGRVVSPNLSKADPHVIGPLTDFMTFYVDLWLAIKANLAYPGDHAYVKRGTPNSWADGTHVVAGQDSIDFDLLFKRIESSDNIAVILVRHIPPKKPQLDLRADWMRASVADTQNNWFEIEKTKDGRYRAAVGKETFDVELRVSLANGKIISATMDNPLSTIERQCLDPALSSCGEPKRRYITRHVEIALVPQPRTGMVRDGTPSHRNLPD